MKKGVGYEMQNIKYKMQNILKTYDCGSRGVTAAASRCLAAGQSSGGLASPVRTESGAVGGSVFGAQPT